jgi:Putative zinc-finger
MTGHWTDRLSEYLDEELSAEERDACEAHLLGCAECREILGELRVIAVEARQLEDAEPAVDLWPGIRERLGSLPARRLGGPVARRQGSSVVRRISLSLPQLLAAGLVFAVLGAGGAVALGGLGGGAPVAGGPVIVGAPAAIPVATLPGEETWDRAVSELRAVLDAGRDKLDPATVRVLEESLGTIDRALDSSRRALAADPANPYLNTHVQETMRRKVALLRHAAALVASQS